MPPNPHIERLVTSIRGETAMEHLHRYAIARDLCCGKMVLDVACGEGYGSALLAQTARDVIGIDICEKTIARASGKYPRKNLRFLVGAATDLPLDSSSIDLVVCFETVEHIVDQATMLAEIKRVLTPTGALIISTPDKDQYRAAGDLPPNPYHVKELSRDEFRELLGGSFPKVEIFGQRVTYASNIVEEKSHRGLRLRHTTYRGDYYQCAAHPGLAQPRYLLALCSEDRLPTINVGLFEDRDYSDFVVRSAREWLAKEVTNAEACPKVQVFAPRSGRWDESRSTSGDLAPGGWRRLRIDLPWGAGDGTAALRLDPGDQIGIVDIAGVWIRSKITNEILWRAKTAVELSGLTVGGTAILTPHERVFRLFSFGTDPQVLLPALVGPKFDLPLIFETWMRVETSDQAIGEALMNMSSAIEEKRTIEQQRALLEIELREARDTAESSRAKIVALRSELEREEREVWDNKVRRADLTARLKDRDQRIQEIQASAAWKIAKPFWKLQRHFSRRPTDTSKSGELVFALDGPGTWTASHDALAMKGWCFARGGPQIIGVRAKIGRKSYFARYGLKREDAAQTAMDYPAAFYSGFSIIVPIPKGTSSVRLEAIAQGRSWEYFHEESLISAKEDGRDVSAHKHESEDVLSKRISFPNGTCEQQPLVLYPRIRANDVLPILAPLIEQHTKRVRSETPFFSVITPTFNTLPRWIAEASASLLNQTFADWEWCLIDDGSQDPKVREMLEGLASAHSRFRPKFVKAAGISSATNEALDLARGEFVCFLDHDDLLHPEALAQMAEKLEEGFDVVYSDEDKLDDKKGTLIEPFFKPEWSPEYFRGAMYVGHLLCVRRGLACRVRLDGAFDGIQDFDFMLRVSETGARIGHIARVLYHWRKTPGSIADTCDAKPHVATLQEKAVNAQLERLGLPARAEPGAIPHRLKIVPAPRKSFPKISIIIPTRDSPELLSRCLNSLYENTTYPKFEVILIDNDTTSTEALEAMRAHPVIRVYLSNPFNFSRANNLGAQHATGEYLVFLNNDTEIIAARWLDHLLYYAEQPDVGAAGALLLHDDGAVQHGGVVLGMRGTADHAMRGFTAKSDGYAGSLSCVREVSAVTAACMMMRKSTFHDLEGFNEHFFTIYQDLDLCLRLRESGLRIIWTPQAVLLHHESLSRQKYYDVVDRYLLLDQWQDTIEGGDPYYNPNLNLEGGDYSLRSNVC